MSDQNGEHDDGTMHSGNVSSTVYGWLKILSKCY